jgi:hypothetical protein
MYAQASRVLMEFLEAPTYIVLGSPTLAGFEFVTNFQDNRTIVLSSSAGAILQQVGRQIKPEG